MRTSRQKLMRGFTLMEMAGVIVIIGLIVGGIVVMQSVIKAARLQNVIREYDTYVKAAKEFQDKYQSLPGDFSGASAIWGSLPSSNCLGSGTAAVWPPVDTSVCQGGSGGGFIGMVNTSSGYVANSGLAMFSAWKELANAKLIDGLFSGGEFVDGQPMSMQPGVNVPQSKFAAAAGWTIFYCLSPSTTLLWGDQYGNVLAFGASVTNDYTHGPIISPADAYSLDQKIDDGYPDAGFIRAWRGGRNPNCIINNTATQYSTTYNATDQNPDCALVFIPGL